MCREDACWGLNSCDMTRSYVFFGVRTIRHAKMVWGHYRDGDQLGMAAILGNDVTSTCKRGTGVVLPTLWCVLGPRLPGKTEYCVKADGIKCDETGVINTIMQY